MGSTDSNSNREERIQKQYKLVRRYTCPCYGELTVIQKKENKEYFAMKEFVSEQDELSTRISKRKIYRHPNLINLVHCWTETQPSICSNLRKIGVLYEYFEKSLDDELNERISQNETHNTAQEAYTDVQLTEMIWQLVDCLNYLEEKGVRYLLGSLKSIKISEKRQIKLLENEQSLLYEQKNGLSHIFNCSSIRRQIPLHPSYECAEYGAISLNREALVVQNIFTVGIIVLCFCLLKQPSQLGIFNKGFYDFERIAQRKLEVSSKYPKTSFHLNQMLKKSFSKYIKYENFIGNYHLTLKENYMSHFFIKNFKVVPLQTIDKSQSKKKFSVLKNRNLLT